jgi:hypothetical protein
MKFSAWTNYRAKDLCKMNWTRNLSFVLFHVVICDKMWAKWHIIHDNLSSSQFYAERESRVLSIVIVVGLGKNNGCGLVIHGPVGIFSHLWCRHVSAPLLRMVICNPYSHARSHGAVRGSSVVGRSMVGGKCVAWRSACAFVNVTFSTQVALWKWELMCLELTLNGLIQKNHMPVDEKKF